MYPMKGTNHCITTLQINYTTKQSSWNQTLTKKVLVNADLGNLHDLKFSLNKKVIKYYSDQVCVHVFMFMCKNYFLYFAYHQKVGI